MTVVFAGFIVFDVGAWLTIFSGAARAYHQGTDALGGLGVGSKVRWAACQSP